MEKRFVEWNIKGTIFLLTIIAISSGLVYAFMVTSNIVELQVNEYNLTLVCGYTECNVGDYAPFEAYLEKNNVPIENATVCLMQFQNNDWIQISNSTTNSSGYALFLIQVLQNGTFQYHARYYG